MADPKQRVSLVEVDYRTLERLQERGQRLSEAQLFAGVGSWDWDLIADRMTWSDQLYRLFGLEPQSQEGSFDAFLDLLDTAEHVEAERAVREARETGQTFVFDHRVSVDDGRIRILESRGQVVLDAVGTPIRMVGTVEDVTDARHALQALRAVERRFRTVIEESSDIVAILDAHGTIRYLSPSSTRILGIDPAVTTDEAASRWSRSTPRPSSSGPSESTSPTRAGASPPTSSQPSRSRPAHERGAPRSQDHADPCGGTAPLWRRHRA